MTLEEAKKILKKEGYFLVKVSKGFEFSELPVWEKPEVVEAKRVVNENGFATAMNTSEWIDRQERLKKEYGKNHIKGDFSWKNSIIPGSPALNESASQFNDALLDEQAKKIAELTKKNERLGKEIARLNKNIYKKNMKIEELRKESSRHLRGKIKMFGENVDLEQMLKDKNAILSDVAEELRLTKIREKNLAELGLKYVGENEELKKELADKVVDKINANALKSAESALAYKEKVIAEKDEVIADLGNELEATKKELEAFKESYKRRIKEESEHFEHIQKICNAGLQKWLIESEYLEKDKPFRFPQLPDFSEEEQKKLSSAKDTHPTEDNPEEIAIEKTVKLVRKAMKEGHTVTIDYKD